MMGEEVVIVAAARVAAARPRSWGGLRPACKKERTVTAGDTSGVYDGAAAVVVMSADKAAGPGLKPLVRIVAFSGAGADLSMMGTDPIPATRKSLEEAGWTVSDLDPVEANEAFAAQAMAVNKELGWDTARVDISGGAISIGHPIADSDARVPVTLLHGM